MNKRIILILILIVFVGCSNNKFTSKSKSSNSINSWYIHAKAKKKDNVITIKGNTNLPDGTQILAADFPDKRQSDTKVNKGEFHTQIKSSKNEVWLLVTPIGQSPNIVQRIGSNGENLKIIEFSTGEVKQKDIGNKFYYLEQKVIADVLK